MYGALFETLPDDLDSLCQAVRNVYTHYGVAREPDSGVPAAHIASVDARYVSAILACVQNLSATPLTESRPPEKRFIGCCRDASLLLCAMLRHKGTPARIRAGFAPYINIGQPGFNVDHVVTEVWDAAAERWKLVDAEQSADLIHLNAITFDTHDIPRDRFLVGGSAWQMWRAQKVNSADFGVARDDFFTGEWAIRNRMLHDLAMLNKDELLLWDTWGWLDKDVIQDAQDYILLDQIAALTTADLINLDAISSLYSSDPRLKAPSRVRSYSPVNPWTEVNI